MQTDWSQYAKDLEQRIAEIKRHLEPLERGTTTHRQKDGDGPWRDVTQEIMDREKATIATYEKILSAVKSC